MPSKPKIAKREYSSEDKWYAQIANHVKLSQTTVAHIINQAAETPDDLYHPIKQTGWPATLHAQTKQKLICHVKQNLIDNLAALGTSSKSGHKLDRKAI